MPNPAGVMRHQYIIIHMFFSHSPDYDTSKQVSSPRDAVSKSEACWSFGLGIELGNDFTGRTIFAFSIDLDVQMEQFDVRYSFFLARRQYEQILKTMLTICLLWPNECLMDLALISKL